MTYRLEAQTASRVTRYRLPAQTAFDNQPITNHVKVTEIMTSLMVRGHVTGAEVTKHRSVTG